MSDSNESNTGALDLSAPNPFCFVRPTRRDYLEPVDRNGHSAAFHNLVKILGQSTIADAASEASESEYDGDDSDSDHDGSDSCPSMSLCDGDKTSFSSDESSTDGDESTSDLHECLSESDIPAPIVNRSSPEDTLSSSESQDYPDHVVTPLTSKRGLALTEGITLEILNIPKLGRQSKTLTNFQQASQYCYALALPVIWNELVVNPESYEQVRIMEKSASGVLVEGNGSDL